MSLPSIQQFPNHSFNEVIMPSQHNTKVPRLVQLHVIHAWGGGLERWVRDYCKADYSKTNLILKSSGTPGEPCQRITLFDGANNQVPIREWYLQNPIYGTAVTDLDYQYLLDEIHDSFSIELIIVSSLIGHSLDILNTQTKTFFICHDYYPFCSAVNIYFDRVCTTCHFSDLQRCFQSNKHNYAFRQVSASGWMSVRSTFLDLVIQNQIHLVAPSESVRQNFIQLEPRLQAIEFSIIPHGLSWQNNPVSLLSGSASEKLRLLILGQLTHHKGLDLLQDSYRDILEFAEIFLLGCGETGRFFAESSGLHVVAETYHTADLPKLIQEIAPDLGLLLSVCPETFSYTLSELMMLGVPTLATQVGAFADRIQDGINGFLVAPEPSALITKLRTLDQMRLSITSVSTYLRQMHHRNIDEMMEDYHQLLQSSTASTSVAGSSTSILHETNYAVMLQAELSRSQAQLRQVQIEAGQTHTQLHQTQAELNYSQTSLQQVQAELNHFQDLLQQAQAELNHSQTSLHSAQVDLKVAQSQSARSLSEVSATRSKLSNSKVMVSQLQTQFRATNTDAQRYRLQLSQLRRALQATNAELVSLRNSVSWKATHPLQTINLLLKQVLGVRSLLGQLQLSRWHKHDLLKVDRDVTESNEDVNAKSTDQMTSLRLQQSGLFDVDYYLTHNPALVLAEIDPISHYLTNAISGGHDPNPLFDSSYYIDHNPDVIQSHIPPLLHYFDHGALEGRNPNPLFDSSYYLEQNPDVTQNKVNPLAHYLQTGALEGRDPIPLFDSSYYLEQNPDVTQSGVNPLVHYLTVGAYEGRDPNPLFDSSYYLEQNPDVAQNHINPLVHYLQTGAYEGRDPIPLFDSSYYLEQNPDVTQSGVNPLVHYLTIGASEGRDPNPLFDSSYYLEQNPDVAQSGVNPLAHYIFQGSREGRIAWPLDQLFPKTQHHAVKASMLHNTLLQDDKLTSFTTRLKTKKIGIYCSSLGNYFMAEIADLLTAAFEQSGMTALRLCELDQRPDDLDYDLVVAPHEFFYLGQGLQLSTAPWINKAILFNLEQPHTQWFSKSLHVLIKTRLVLDIDIKSAEILRQLGISSYFFPLGYLQDYDPFTAVAQLPNLLALQSLPSYVKNYDPKFDLCVADRPIDLFFVGTLNDRRQQFWAESAAWLHRFQCFLHIPPIKGPLLQGQGNALTTEAVIGLSRRSKILLNVHRDNLAYFEWHRIIFHGLWQKTLVVTEPCHPVPGLIPDVHYIECKVSEMAAQIEWLLTTEEGLAKAEQVRCAGYQALREQFDLKTTTMRLIELLQSPAIAQRR
jgi:glycosyltransferase involved in cell wall biosynthesis